MPVSPEYALDTSPAAALTEDEINAHKRICDKVDELLTTQWPGTPFTVRGPDFYSAKVAARIQRGYSEAGWHVQMQPLDGALGSAAELLAGGATLQWVITLAPNWRP